MSGPVGDGRGEGGDITELTAAQPMLYARGAKIWISQGVARISTASRSVRPLAKAPPLPLAVLTCRL